jgi:hypothetical protein
LHEPSHTFRNVVADLQSTIVKENVKLNGAVGITRVSNRANRQLNRNDGVHLGRGQFDRIPFFNSI